MSLNPDEIRPWKWREEEDIDIAEYLSAVSSVCSLIAERHQNGTNDSITKIAEEMVARVGEAMRRMNPYDEQNYDKYENKRRADEYEAKKNGPTRNLDELLDNQKIDRLKDYAGVERTHPEIKKLTEILNKTGGLLKATPGLEQKQCADACVELANKLRIEPSIVYYPLAFFRCLAIILVGLTTCASQPINLTDKKDAFIHRLSSNLTNGLFYYLGGTASHQDINNVAVKLQREVVNKNNAATVTHRDAFTAIRVAAQNKAIRPAESVADQKPKTFGSSG